MFELEPITGAYGRTYNSLASAQKDFDAGKDFLCANGHSYCNKQDLKDYASIHVRYGKNLTKQGTIIVRKSVT